MITNMKAKYILTLVIAGLIAASFAGCSLLKKRTEKTEKIEYKLNSKGKFRLEVDNSNGNIDVTSSNDTLGYIYITAEKTGRVKESEMDKPIEGINIKIDTTDEIIKINTVIERTYGFFKKSKDGRVNYRIRIPSNFRLVAETVNGAIRTENLNSDIRLETVNGSIVVNKCSGVTDLSTVNGSIKGNFDSTKGIVAETVNGSISLGNLKNISADVNASVINGRLKYNNLNFTGLSFEKKNLNGVLGNGNIPIRLSTVNGKITLDGNPIGTVKEEDRDFEFKIDFDDDEHIKIIEKNVETHKTQDSIKLQDTPKSPDSLKKK